MPDQNTQKSINENLDTIEQEAKGFFGKLSQERAYEILSQGIVLTMEEDLKNEANRQQMKANLIPNETRKKEQEAVFSQKPVFDPFQEIKNPVQEKLVEKEAKPISEFVQFHQKTQGNQQIETQQPSEALLEKPLTTEPIVVSKEVKEDLQREVFESLEIEKTKDLQETKESTQEQPKEQFAQLGEKIVLDKENFEKTKQDVAKKIIDIEFQQKNIESQKVLLIQRRKTILEKIDAQKVNLEILVAKTLAIKKQQFLIEQQEQSAKDGAAKRAFEEQRWRMEENLKQAQDAQWAQEEEIEKAQMALSKIDNDLRVYSGQQISLAEEKSQYEKFLEELGLIKKKKEFLDKNKSFIDQKNQLEKRYKEIANQKDLISQELAFIVQLESSIEQEERNIEQKIQQATEAQERRKLEQERREVAQKRRTQEKKRWEAEKNQEIVNNNFRIVKDQLEKIKKEEDGFNQKVLEIEAKMSKSSQILELGQPIPIEKEISPLPERAIQEKIFITEPETTKEEKEIVEKIRLQAKAKEQELIQEQFLQRQINDEKIAAQKEYQEKQEEENREKAIKTLRQIAQQEQQKAISEKPRGPMLKEEFLRKLTKNSNQEEIQRKDFLLRISKKTKPLPKQKPKVFEENVIFHPMIKKSSLFEKILVRILVILVILGIIVVFYFGSLFLVKNNNKPPLDRDNFSAPINQNDDWPSILPDDSTSSENIINQNNTTPFVTKTQDNDQPQTSLPAPKPPIALIPIITNNIFSYTDETNLMAETVSGILNNSIELSLFEQISVLDEVRQVYLSPQEFFEILGAKLPEGFFQIQGTSTILVFASQFGNRLGFIIQTESAQEAKNQFMAWESKAERDTESLYLLMGKTIPAIRKTFLSLSYKTVPIRCQTFTKSDLGICYFVYKDYFVWASSFEQASRIVDKLK